MTATATFLALTVVDQANAGFGKNLSDWGRDQLEPLYYLAIGVGFVACMFAKRASIWALYIAGTILGGIYVLNPEAIGKLAEQVGNNL